MVGRTVKGLPVVQNLFWKLDEVRVSKHLLMSNQRSDDATLFFTTRAGIVKGTSDKEFANTRQNGPQSL